MRVCVSADRPPSSVDEIFMKGNAYSFGRHAWAASIVQESCTARYLEMLAIDKLLLGKVYHHVIPSDFTHFTRIVLAQQI